MTHSGADIATLLAAHGLRPSRALGQNFVADPNTVRRIARLADIGPGSSVLEFGAGLGSLSLALAETGARVVAVEVDRHLLPVLRTVVEPAGVEVIAGDAMTLDVAALLEERGGGSWSLVANLPYNLATPLVLRTLVEVPAIERLLVMVQREVGERFAAAPGTSAYGIPSVLAQLACEVKVLRPISRTVFRPVPNVDSVLLGLRRVGPAADARVSAIVHGAFAHRRKALAGSLARSPGMPPDVRERARAALVELGHPADERAERLAPGEFRELTTRVWP